MSEHTETEWLCPICGLVRVPYGTSPCKRDCGNEPHITGAFYVRGVMVTDARGVGISEISDESQEDAK